MLSEIGKLHLAQFMRENFLGTFRYDLEKKEMKSEYVLGVDVDIDYICIAMMDKGNGKILAHNEYKTESILSQPIYRKDIDTYKSEILDYCRDYIKEVYEHYINIFKVSHRDLEFINQLTKQELIERLNKHIKEKKMLSEKLVNKIDKKLQEYIDINKLVLSDVDMINDVKDMIFYILEKNNLVELPCKVGDKCYPLLYHSKLTEEKISRITITKRNIIIGYFEHNGQWHKPLRTRTLGEDVWLKEEDIPPEYKRS